MKTINASLWYGMSEYPKPLSKAVQAKFEAFLEAARKELSKRSGGFNLDSEPDISLHIHGNGWSLNLETQKPIDAETLKKALGIE